MLWFYYYWGVFVRWLRNMIVVLANYCLYIYINLELGVAQKRKTWHPKWDWSLHCLFWALCRIRITRCHSIKWNLWSTRVYNNCAGCFRTGRRSKINISLMSRYYMANSFYPLCWILMFYIIWKDCFWGTWCCSGSPRRNRGWYKC